MGGPARFRFQPRFRGLAVCAAAVGAGLLAAAAIFGLGGASLGFALTAGGLGVVLGALYLSSPAWRLSVVVRDDALEVEGRAGERRLRLPWPEIERVVASPDTKTCFVDGGAAERSLLVPGPGASAPYHLERREALYDEILARAPAHAVEEVGLLKDASPRAREQPLEENGEPGERDE